jgi:tRNA(fMet)-specific endonuclease VapC
MNFLVDTDVCSAFLRGDHRVANRFLQYGGQVAISTVVVGELSVAAYRFGSQSTFARGLGELVRSMTVLPFDLPCADRFGQVRAGRLSVGQPAAAVDMMIAATALLHDLMLVTHNTSHSSGIPDLQVVDWMAP